VDTKTQPDGQRCQLTIRDTYMHGWNQPSQIANMAALNLKEHLAATVERCVFSDNEIALRVRGPGKRGGAHVTVIDCAIYDTQVGIRAEDKIEQLKVRGLGYGEDVGQRLTHAGGKELPGYESTGEHGAPPLETLLKSGFPLRTK
jgi:hypothetical protein